MMRIVLLLVAFLLYPASLNADEGGSLSFKVYLPRIGVIDLGEVNVSVIPSPLVVVERSNKPSEMEAVPEEYEYNPQYAKPVWDELKKRKWLLLKIKTPSVIELDLPEIPPLLPGFSYHAYVSPEPDNALTLGRLVGPDRLDVLFRYFTINIDADQIPKIEAKRDALIELGRTKSRFKFRARLVRVETSASNLFTPGTDIIDFLDFYLTDIEFLN